MEVLSYKRYVETFWTLEKYSLEYGFQLEKLLQITHESFKDGFSVLDIGAGTGAFGKSFLESVKLKPSSYCAIEPSEENVKLIQKNLADIRIEKLILNQRFTRETSLERKFDLIIMSHCFYWLQPNPELYLKQALKHLNQNGKIVAFIGTHTNFCYLLNCCFGDKINLKRMPNHYFSSFELCELLDRKKIKYSVSYLPGTLLATKALEPEGRAELMNLIAFSVLLEPSSIDAFLLKQMEDFLRQSAYRDGSEFKLNLGVATIEITI